MLIFREPQRRFANKPSDHRIRRWRCRGPPPPKPTAWTRSVFRHQTTFCFHHSLPFSHVSVFTVCCSVRWSTCRPSPAFLSWHPLLGSRPHAAFLFSPFNLISFSFHPHSFLSSKPFLLCSFLPFSSPFLLFSSLTADTNGAQSVGTEELFYRVYIGFIFQLPGVGTPHPVSTFLLCLFNFCFFKQNKEVKMRKQSTPPADFTQRAGMALQW